MGTFLWKMCSITLNTGLNIYIRSYTKEKNYFKPVKPNKGEGSMSTVHVVFTNKIRLVSVSSLYGGWFGYYRTNLVSL